MGLVGPGRPRRGALCVPPGETDRGRIIFLPNAFGSPLRAASSATGERTFRHPSESDDEGQPEIVEGWLYPSPEWGWGCGDQSRHPS